MTFDELLGQIPIIGTIKRAFFTDWKGGSWQDYQSCILTAHDCEGLGKVVAKIQCERCISQLTTKYIKELPSPPLIKDLLGALGSGIALQVSFKTAAKTTVTMTIPLIKKAVEINVKLALKAVGVVLALDLLADVVLYFTRKFRINRAAQEAKDNFCKC